MDKNIIIAKDIVRLARELVAGNDVEKELESEFSDKDVARNPEKVLERFTELVDDEDLDRAMQKMHLSCVMARRRALTAASEVGVRPKPTSKYLTAPIGNDKDGKGTDKATLFKHGFNSSCFELDPSTGVVSFTYKTIHDKFSIFDYIEMLDDGTDDMIVKTDDDKLKQTVLQNLMPEEQDKVIESIDNAIIDNADLRDKARRYENDRKKMEEKENSTAIKKFQNFVSSSLKAIAKFLPPAMVIASIIYIGIQLYFGKQIGGDTLSTIMTSLREIAVPKQAIELVSTGLAMATGVAFRKQS